LAQFDFKPEDTHVSGAYVAYTLGVVCKAVLDEKVYNIQNYTYTVSFEQCD